MKRSLLIAILIILTTAAGCAMKRDTAIRRQGANDTFNQNIGQYDRWLIEMGITPTTHD